MADSTKNIRKRIKIQCTECGSKFDDDYRIRHERLVHGGKRVKIKVAGAPANPFEAASYGKKVKMYSLI